MPEFIQEVRLSSVETERQTTLKFPNGDNFDLAYLHVTPGHDSEFYLHIPDSCSSVKSSFQTSRSFLGSIYDYSARYRFDNYLEARRDETRKRREDTFFDMRALISRSCLLLHEEELTRDRTRNNGSAERGGGRDYPWKFESSLHLN